MPVRKSRRARGQIGVGLVIGPWSLCRQSVRCVVLSTLVVLWWNRPNRSPGINSVFGKPTRILWVQQRARFSPVRLLPRPPTVPLVPPVLLNRLLSARATSIFLLSARARTSRLR